MGHISDLQSLPFREVMERDAKDYADSIHAIFVETSAKNAININELFIEISEYLCAIWLFPVQGNFNQNCLSGWNSFLVSGMVLSGMGVERVRVIAVFMSCNCWRAAA